MKAKARIWMALSILIILVKYWNGGGRKKVYALCERKSELVDFYAKFYVIFASRSNTSHLTKEEWNGDNEKVKEKIKFWTRDAFQHINYIVIPWLRRFNWTPRVHRKSL